MAKKRKVGPRKPQFFRPLLPGFDEKLSLPSRFLKHLTNEKLEEATILSRIGKSWHIKVHWNGNGDGAFFGDGWKEFALAHDLGIGYFLVFRYEGDMVFNATVFDLSLCEKQYSPMVGNGVIDNGIKREDQSPANNLNSPHSNGQTTAEAKPPVTRSRVQQTSRETNVVEVSEDQEPFETGGLHFKITIMRSNIFPKPYLYVPRAFIAATDILTKHQFILRDPEKRLFPVTLVRGTQNRTFFTRGWRDFSVSNNLNLGDVCEFQYPTDSNHENIMQAHIFKQSAKPRWSKYSSNQQQTSRKTNVVEDSEDQEPFETRGLHFKITITHSNIFPKPYLDIPSSCQALHDLSGMHQVILVDPEHRSWPVKVYCMTKKNKQIVYRFGLGWQAFYVNNNLEEGNVCILELVSKEEGLIHVHIDRQERQKIMNSLKRKFECASDLYSCNGKPAEPSCDQMTSETMKLGKSSPTRKVVSVKGIVPCQDQKPFEEQAVAHGRHFEATIKSCNLRGKAYMHIPNSFHALNDLSDVHQMKLIDQKGRVWPVNMQHSITNKKKKFAGFGFGWQAFWSHNNLEEGDVCIFELVSKEKNDKMLVCILKKQAIPK